MNQLTAFQFAKRALIADFMHDTFLLMITYSSEQNTQIRIRLGYLDQVD